MDRSGSPIAGAEVRCEEGGEARSATTDAEGRLDLPARPGETTRRFTVRHVGHVSRTIALAPGRWESVTLEEGIGLRCVLLQEGGALELPLVGARVLLMSAEGPSTRQLSDRDGAFLCRYPLGALVELDVFWGESCQWSTSFQVPKDVLDLVFRVPRPDVLVDLRVVAHPDKTPVPNAEVRLNTQVIGTTDESGDFSFGLSKGSVGLRVSAPGYCDWAYGVRATEPRQSLEVPLVLAGSLFGRVVDESEVGIPGATVRVIIEDSFSSPVVRGVSPTNPITVSTAEDGTFEIRGLGSSREAFGVQLVISHPDKATHRSDRVNMRNGARVGPLEFVLSEGAVLVGIVTFNGVPAGSTLFLDGRRAEEAQTDDEGRYTLCGLEPGDATLFSYLDEHRGVYQSWTTRLSPGVNRKDLEFTIGVAHIRGTALGSTTALDHCQVRCEVESLDEEEPASYTAWTDEFGRFDFEVPVEAGDGLAGYTLSLSRWEGDCVRTDVLAGSEVSLECAPSARVKLVPVGSEGWQVGYRFARASWYREGETNRTDCWGQTPPGGSVEFELPIGRGRLVLSSGEEESSPLSLELREGEFLDLGVVRLEARN